MRKSVATVTAVIAAAIALAATAAQPQTCVNPQLLNGLVFLGRGEMKISVARGQPAFMKNTSLPADLVLIGSGVPEAGSTVVAYKTSLTSGKAHAAFVAALGAEGWAEEATAGSAATFNVAGAPRQVVLCRDGERRYVTVTEVAGVRYVTVDAFPLERRRACNEDPLMSMGMMSLQGSVAPRFQFPEGTSLAQGFGGGGGSSTLFTTSSRIISADTPARLVGHLASQLENQGWQPDADWSGSVGAGSTWRRTHEGEPMWGTLEITRVSEGTYDVDFTMALPE